MPAKLELPQPTKDKVAELNAETELIKAQIANDEAKGLRDKPAALKQKEGELAEKESQQEARDAELASREAVVSQQEKLVGDAMRRLSEQKSQIEDAIKGKLKELAEAVGREQSQRDEVEVALSYITGVAPILINPDVRREIVNRLERCLERWGIVPQYDTSGKYVRSVYRNK